MRFKQHSVLPGFGLGLGYTLFWLCLIVLLPLAALLMKSASLSAEAFWAIVSTHATKKPKNAFSEAANKDALVDLPFALPTAVAGISLTTLYAPNGWFGQYLVPLGINVAFTPLGILVALTFISLPFVVRTVQPVLEDLEAELEEAATCLGATRWQIFSRVLFPAVLPALLTGFTLAFARATGEFGSVIFIAGNIPMVSEIAPLLIIGKLEQFDFLGATAIAVVMLVISFVMLFAINLIQWWSSRRHGMTR